MSGMVAPASRAPPFSAVGSFGGNELLGSLTGPRRRELTSPQVRRPFLGPGREAGVAAPRHVDVLVVGAGPTGLVAALSLAEAGLAVEIVDEEWRTAGHSYALALHPRSLRQLSELGLAQAAIAHGRKLEALTILAGDDAGAAI